MQILRWIVGSILLLGHGWANAAGTTYTLPAQLASICSGTVSGSGTTYQCAGNVSIGGNNDAVTLSSNLNLTITGSFSLLGTNISVNTSSAYNLNLSVGGAFSTGNNTNIVANITASGPVSLGNNAVVTGNVTGSSITFGNPNTVVTGTCTPSHSQCGSVQLGKTASAGAAQVGSVVTFSITATNKTTSDLANVTVTDTLPASMSYSASAPTLGSVGVVGQVITWSIPLLPASGSAQLTLAVNLLTQGTQTNTVTSSHGGSASASVLVLSSAVTHYRFDETAGAWSGTAGEVLDSGTTGLNGKRVASSTPTSTNTVNPSPTIASQHGSVVGGFCNAASFDSKAVVQVPYSSAFQYSKVLSASAWIYPTAYPSSGGLYSILSNDVNYEFHINSAGKLNWWWSYEELTSATTIPKNQWTHVAITFNSTTGRQRMYINGVQDSNTKAWTGTLKTNPCNVYIGGDIGTPISGASCPTTPIPGRNWRGMIDEVKLYNYELSASDVQADMTLGRNCSGTYDHIRIEHDGTGSICTPETVTVKACLNASCTSLYTGNVTVQLTPTGWTGSDTFTFSGGVTTRSLGVAAASTVTLGAASASPLPANTARCFNGSTETCSMVFSSASCNFDAVEVGASAKTRLFTKKAGTAFNVDILAITGSSVNTTINSAVNVDLVDASTTNCPTGSGLTTAQSVTLVSGRKTASFTYAQPLPNVRVRIKQGASAAACSTDNFAIRPDHVTLVTTANATAPSAASSPTVKAGQNFTLYGTSTTGYTTAGTLNTAKLTAQNTSQDSSIANGGTVGILGLNSLPVNPSPVPSNNASYSEAGYLYLAAGAYRDNSFTAVDQPTGCSATGTCDCITDTASDNNLSTSLVGSTGKYGCHIGSTAAALGRFIPDHFVIAAAAPVAGCTVHPSATGSYTPTDFTYFGNPAGFNTPFTLTAVNAAATPATTQNYSGVFARLGAGGWSWTGSSATTGLRFGTASALPAGAALTAATSGGTPVAPAGTWANGVLNLSTAQHQISRPTARTGETAVTITAWPLDPDGVTTAAASAVSDTSTPLRWGRIRLQNAHGSERLPLPLPVQAQMWDGVAFVRNTDDSCTTVSVPAARTLATGASPDGVANRYFYPVAGKNQVSSTDTSTSMASAVAGGVASLLFTAPTKPGWIDVIFSVPSYLLEDHGNCMGQSGSTGAFDDRPCARATFGIYKSPLIYRRENY